MINLTFGRLTVVELDHRDAQYQKWWVCQCDCGAEIIARGDRLRSGKTRSCGCLYPVAQPETWLINDPTWRSWSGMMHRCYDPNTRHFHYWGGKGVTVCDRWHSYENFRTDMGVRPSAAYSIDRIAGAGNYEPGNCRWATAPEQRRNAATPKHYRTRKDKGVKRGKYKLKKILNKNAPNFL